MAKDTEPLLGGSMKSPIDLLQFVLADCEHGCRVSTSRDLKRIATRFKHEGYSFLGITLANYGKDFQKDLDRGFVSPDSYRGFTRRAGLPELLRGFLENVFEVESGVLRPSPCVDCIRSVRQITLMWSKLKQRTTPEREAVAFRKYKERDKHVQSVALRIFEEHLFRESSFRRPLSRLPQGRTSLGIPEETTISSFIRMSKRLFGPTLSWIDQKVYRGEIVPSHGSGSVAERLSGNQKWSRGQWDIQLEGVFPVSEFFYSSWSQYCETEVSTSPSAQPIPVRVIAVPKTHDKPRIIAMEPTAKQYMQQGLMKLFAEAYASPRLLGDRNYSHNFIDYQSQKPNQLLAMKGSHDGSLATLDLSDASDSVSYLLVHYLLSGYPHLREAVDATRSRNADVPGHGIMPLAKFASMGSALCFPIEAMVFCTIVFLGIEEHRGTPLSKKEINSLIDKVRVYGDDIIVPTDYARSVVDALELYGFEVSLNKSFMNGKFRESCGQDCYGGHDVNIVKLRRALPTQRRQTEELISAVETRNQFYKFGYWKTVREYDRLIESLIPFPAMAEGAPGLGKVSFLGYESQNWDSHLQRPLVKAAVPVYKKRRSPLDGYRALDKWFFFKQEHPKDVFLDKDHLLYAGRPVAVDIKHRWIHPDYGMDVD